MEPDKNWGSSETTDGDNDTKGNNGEVTYLSSHRSREVTNTPSFLFKWLRYASSNPFDAEKNPQGIVNLGTAENKLCEDLLVKKLSEPNLNKTEGYMNYYFNNIGDLSFRSALATFLEDRFNPVEELDPDNIAVSCGCGSVLEILAFALGEENDHFLSPSPYFPRIKNNFGERAGLRIYEVPLTSKLELGDSAPFQLRACKLERAYQKAVKEGKRIRGIVLINPNNPLGDVYTEEQLTEILEFANRYNLHVVFDEIYALSTFDENTAFRSVLSLKNVPDPQRVHFVWGFSKDFALAGYRCAILYTKNKDVLEYYKAVSYYQTVPIFIQRKLQMLISDREWRDYVYFPTNLRRMRANHDVCARRLKALNIPIHPSRGGLFVWINLREYMPGEASFLEERDLFERLIHNGVYCVPGESMYCSEPGWFRLVFTVTREELLVGLNRIEATLSKGSNNSKSTALEMSVCCLHFEDDGTRNADTSLDTSLTEELYTKQLQHGSRISDDVVAVEAQAVEAQDAPPRQKRTPETRDGHPSVINDERLSKLSLNDIRENVSDTTDASCDMEDDEAVFENQNMHTKSPPYGTDLNGHLFHAPAIFGQHKRWTVSPAGVDNSQVNQTHKRQEGFFRNLTRQFYKNRRCLSGRRLDKPGAVLNMNGRPKSESDLIQGISVNFG